MSKMTKAILISMFSLMSSSVFAATILVDDTFGITGSYAATGGTDLSDATLVQLGSVTAVSATIGGDFATTINSFPPPTGTAGSALNIGTFTNVDNFFTLAGWQIDLTSVTISDQNTSILNLVGSGVASGNGYDATGITWSFSGNSPTNYSMTITSTGIPAVPVPAAVWLFGSGLLGLIGVARRRV